MWALFLAMLLACAGNCQVFAQMDAENLGVLSDFKASMKNGDQLGWEDSQDPCSWKGIKCSGSFISSINLASLDLGGSVTPNLNKLASLTSISLQRNGFTGPLPSLSGLSSLQSCYLNDNNFDTIPWDFFSTLPSLRYLYMHNNPLLNSSSAEGGWSLPADLQASTFLTNLTLTNTSLVGEIPSFLGSMSSLSVLSLAYNKLGGGIPSSLGSSSLQQFQANNQLGPRLSGNLNDVGNMISLRLLWLHENEFSGILPPNLTNSISLSDLRLNNNKLVGPIPPSYTTLPLTVFAVENNQLDGPLPRIGAKFTYHNNLFCQDTMGAACAPQVSALLGFLGNVNYPNRLVSSWSGDNPCASWIGILCDSKGNVVVINLASSNLSGVIDPSIAQLTSLTTLKLNDNHLTGTVPSALASLALLKTLDVSNNNLTGPLPIFARDVGVNTAGNPFINMSISSSSNGPASSNKAKEKTRLPNAIPIAVAVLVTLIALASMMVCYRCKRRNADEKRPTKQPLGVRDSTRVGSEDTSFALSLRTLQMATDNFSAEFYLGRGGFGSVYKGRLDDGTLVAVKRMETGVMTSQGQREFQSEVNVLTKLRHRHIVAILGYCIEGDEKALVYEYMPAGTLSQHLFGWSRGGLSPLSWKSRLSIVLDVARGLEYLHGLAQSRFIHRDLKPSNILLDENLRAKISDFGLMRLVPEGEQQSVQTLVAGTIGYLAPEYANTGHITTKGDVFSFGVVIMELITGQPAVDKSQPGGGSHLMLWFRRVIKRKDKLLEALDPSMAIDCDDDETVQGICMVAELAGHCTNNEASSRPDMGHAVNLLAPLVKGWKPSDDVDDESEANLTPEEVRRKLLSLNDLTMTMDVISDSRTASSSSRPAQWQECSSCPREL
ncbi:hypothetical protein GOP47_0028202 [Adiantum capillus-veneris]|nr:hypothetical protein GOP47_0028202 [Adiantum capillus-veneris]